MDLEQIIILFMMFPRIDRYSVPREILTGDLCRVLRGRAGTVEAAACGQE